MKRIRPLIVILASALCLALTAPAGPSASEPEGADKPASARRMIHKRVGVVAANDDWSRTGLRVEPGDVVVFFAQGTVRVAERAKPVEANGNYSGDGRLEAKVGSGPAFPVGKSYAFSSGDRGIVKLRVSDSRYDDNTGGFEVSVLLIPAAIIPEAVPVDESEE
jgi:hypothetical protein